MLRGKRKLLLSLLGLLLLVLGYLCVPLVWDWAHEDEVLITISPEVTRLVEPVREDGYVDYWAYLESQTAEGVTPENNAAIVLWETWGPKQLSPDDREVYFDALGVEVPLANGEYLQEWMSLIISSPEQLAKIPVTGMPPLPADENSDGNFPATELEENVEFWSLENPWSDAQVPYGQAWIVKYKPQVNALIDGANRPHFYAPMSRELAEDCMLALQVPDLLLLKRTIRTLCFYAMGQVGQSNTAEATAALLAALRWNRHTSHRIGMLGRVIGCEGEISTWLALASLACAAELSAEDLRQLQEQIQDLPSPASWESALEKERWMMLETFSIAARKGIAYALGDLHQDSWLERIEDRRTRRWIHWDELFQKCHQLFDLEIAVVKASTESEREQAEQARDQFLDLLAQLSPDAQSTIWDAHFSSREEGQQKTQARLLRLLAPNMPGVMGVEEKRATVERLAKVALNLCLYRAEEGAFPKDLAALVPKYLPELPTDCYAESLPLHYQLEDGEFILYSCGPNRKDEKGIGAVKGDDLFIHSKPTSHKIAPSLR